METIEWQLIEDDASLRELLAQHADATAVAVDTEFMRQSTFYPKEALLQLCFDNKAWLIDPLKITELEPLRDLMTAPGIIKVLHSPSEDLEVFSLWLDALPSPLFDTQRAAALLDRGFGMGYRALVQELCDITLPKDETRSDWLQRPLTDAQCQYAAQDVLHLLDVYHQLAAECEAQGKLDWVLSDGEDAINNQAAVSPSYHTRIKSAWKLDSRQLAALIAICEWRDQTARSKDKPRSWIIDDQACLQLAAALPTDYEAMRAALELPEAVLRRYSDQLLRLLSEQAKLPEEDLPQPLPAPLSARQRGQGKYLRREAKKIAAQLQVAPEVLLQAKDYEALIRELEADGSQAEPLHWQGWRAEHVIEPLRQLLQGSKL
ncbi:ribonuclease D [Sediminihaliea albiluteola]|uniref:ribonuclease D n=1 Tax=Sediminihaliea albiluteola TaxID=2758564 RepID=UPI002E2E7356|nr:ribonuclease D [Sediminihaliea albiluteola]